jgi:hypothetical protein
MSVLFPQDVDKVYNVPTCAKSVRELPDLDPPQGCLVTPIKSRQDRCSNCTMRLLARDSGALGPIEPKGQLWRVVLQPYPLQASPPCHNRTENTDVLHPKPSGVILQLQSTDETGTIERSVCLCSSQNEGVNCGPRCNNGHFVVYCSHREYTTHTLTPILSPILGPAPQQAALLCTFVRSTLQLFDRLHVRRTFVPRYLRTTKVADTLCPSVLLQKARLTTALLARLSYEAGAAQALTTSIF